MTELVLLHGVGLDHRMWKRCRDALESAHRVHAPDLLGHGSAAATPDGATLDDLAAHVATRLPASAHVVGFSLGALVAQRIALTRPELVRSLVLVSAVARRSAEQAARVGQRLTTAKHDFDAAATSAVDRWMSAQWQDEEPALAHELHETLVSNGRTSYLRCYQIFATADRWLWPELPNITAPTLAVTGADDIGSTPEMSQRLAATIPNAHAVVVPDARHLLPLEKPNRLSEAILAHTTKVDDEYRPISSL